MANFKIVPGVDDQHNFPPEIRAAIAKAPELKQVFTEVDRVTAAVQLYVSSLIVTNNSLVSLGVESGYVWGLVDASGHIALGVRPDGQVVGKISLAAGTLNALSMDTDTQSRLVNSGAGSQVSTLTPEQAGGWVYVITSSTGQVAFGIQADGSVVLPKFTLPAGSVDVAQLSTTLQSTFPKINPVESGFIWAVTDSAGRVGLGLKPDGTFFAAKTSFSAYSLRNSENASYIAQPFIDSSGKNQFRVIRKVDGQITFTTSGSSNSVEPLVTTDSKILYKNDGTGVFLDLSRSAEGGLVWSEIARPAIYCPGDSLTQGAGASVSSNNYPSVLAATLGTTAYNDGIGGQGVQSITARANSDLALLTVAGNTIPTSGPVSITACVSTSTNAIVNPLGAGSSTSRSGTLAGVHGVLTDINDTGHTMTFTADAGGSSPTACPPASPFVFDIPIPYQDATWSIMMGRNNIPNGATQSSVVSTITAAVASTIAAQKAYSKRFVVMPVLPFSDRDSSTGGSSTGWGRSNLLAVNAALLAAYPTNFVDIMTYLQSNQAATDAGITYTSQDLTDISNGVTPTSFRSDFGHLNDISYPLVGKYIAKFMRSKGWYA